MDDRDLARLFSVMRVSAGGVMFMAPKWSLRVWTGAPVASTEATMAARGLGARDVAIGLGALIAMSRGAPVRGWLEAGVTADVADAVSSVAAFRRLPFVRAALSLGVAGGAATLGWRLVDSLS